MLIMGAYPAESSTLTDSGVASLSGEKDVSSKVNRNKIEIHL